MHTMQMTAPDVLCTTASMPCHYGSAACGRTHSVNSQTLQCCIMQWLNPFYMEPEACGNWGNRWAVKWPLGGTPGAQWAFVLSALPVRGVLA